MDIKVSLSIGYPGAVREDIITIEDEALKGLAKKMRNAVIDGAVEEWAWNYIELDWRVAKEGEA